MASMEYETENGRYEGMPISSNNIIQQTCINELADIDMHSPRIEEPRYERDRSASPRPIRRGDDDYGSRRDDSYQNGRDRSASPNGRVDSRYVAVCER